jgi:hypothetical protein
MDVSDADEDTHWRDVMRALLSYEDFVGFDLQRRQEHLNRLSNSWADRLPNMTFDKLSNISHASKNNQEFFKEMVEFQCGESTAVGLRTTNMSPNKNVGDPIPYSQQHRNLAILHSAYREWSAEGADEVSE